MKKNTFKILSNFSQGINGVTTNVSIQYFVPARNIGGENGLRVRKSEKETNRRKQQKSTF